MCEPAVIAVQAACAARRSPGGELAYELSLKRI